MNMTDKTEADFQDGEHVVYANSKNTQNFSGRIDYSYGDEREGFIRVQQVFTETPDEGNQYYIPASQVYKLASRT